MANLSKASNVVQEKYILYDVTGFPQQWLLSQPTVAHCSLCTRFKMKVGSLSLRSVSLSPRVRQTLNTRSKIRSKYAGQGPNLKPWRRGKNRLNSTEPASRMV